LKVHIVIPYLKVDPNQVHKGDIIDSTTSLLLPPCIQDPDDSHR